MEKVVSLMSGGIDSFLMTYNLSNTYQVFPLFVDYGHLSRNQELCAVEKQVKLLDNYNLHILTVGKLSELLINNLTVKETNDDFYPGRNLMLLVLAGQVAYSMGISSIAIGIIKSERGYPDTSSNFINKTEKVLSIAFDRKFCILTPMIEVTKREEILEYKALDLPPDLTYSCQKGHSKGCVRDFKCDSCKEIDDAISWYNSKYG